MGIILNEKKRKCDVITNGPIAELGFVTGPVYNCNLSSRTIIRLVTNGKKVYEINPSNPTEKVLLTIATCENSPFDEIPQKKDDEKPVAPEAPKTPEVVMTPETNNTDTFHAMLIALGKTTDDWNRLSKGERKRLKLQYSEMNEEKQDVTVEQNDENQIPNETLTDPVVENNAAEQDTTTTVDENESDNVNEETVAETEEAVISTDM